MASQTNDNDRIAFEKVYLLWVKIRKFKERRNKDYRSEGIECHLMPDHGIPLQI